MKTAYWKLGCLEKGLILAAVLGAVGIPVVHGEDIPTPWYVPESGTFKATLGALTNDIDNFMSVNMFRNVQIPNFMGYLGIDTNGLNLGYARNLGSLYIGICYGGSLIDDLYRRITNQSSDSVLKRDTETTTELDGGESSINTEHGIVDMDGNPVPGTIISKNDVSMLLGFGNYGLKVGFSQYLQGTYHPEYDRQYNELIYHPFQAAVLVEEPKGMSSRMQITEEFISGLRPYLEFGGTIDAGSVLVKPSLRAGLDIHQYSRNNPETSFIFDVVNEDSADTELKYIIINNTDVLGDFLEPSAGLSLGFDFTQDPSIQTELALDYDMAFRLYSNNKKAAMFETTYKELLNQKDQSQSLAESAMTEITKFYLTNHLVPSFRLRSDMGERLTMGLTVGINIDFNIFKDSAVTTYSPGTSSELIVDPVEYNTQLLSVLPKLGLGLSFKLIPEHFLVNVGIGINVLKYEERTVVSPDPDLENPETQRQKTMVSKTLTLPSTNLGTGLTFYFNKNTAADMLIMASGLGADASDLLKFNFMVTMKY
ncbi:MAG: hypothetical protein LBU25_08660 [Treponema sp.]|jgi:hypothetical protein|nr:hypothetical protein [Treponema sp.]